MLFGFGDVILDDAESTDQKRESRMEHMMDGGMSGMGIGRLILLILIVLVFAVLVKYVFFR
jgi:hypothetical protein